MPRERLNRLSTEIKLLNIIIIFHFSIETENWDPVLYDETAAP